MEQRIALVGTNIEEMRFLSEALTREGYIILNYEPTEEAIGALLGEAPELLLLEMASLQAIGNLSDLTRSEEKGKAPAVMALLRPDQIAEYDYTLGLADFLVWPTTLAELTTRVKQALWRRTFIDSDNLLKFGDLILDLANYKVYVAGHQVELTYKEYELLRFLATHSDRVYSREALLNHVWGYDYYGGARTVDVHIRRLRSKLEDRTHVFIDTVRNVGYRFRVS